MYTHPFVYVHAGTAGMVPAYHADGVTGMVPSGAGKGMHQAKAKNKKT